MAQQARALDRAIAEHVMQYRYEFGCPRFSSDIGAAWAVVERMLRHEDRVRVDFALYMSQLGWMDTAAGTARTICTCALAALGVAVPDGQ